MSDTVQWWFNNKTGEVESGKQSLGLDLDGPFTSKEEAQRAPEIARERSKAWEEDESRD